MNKRRWYTYIKDCVIYGIVILLLIFVAYEYFSDTSGAVLLELMTQYVGTLVTILLGVLGVIEFAYDNGLSLFVPSTFERYKEKRMQEQTKNCLADFFKEEAEFVSQHSNSRITFLLNQLGLNRNQFEKLKLNILDIKLLPLHCLEDAKRKILDIITCGGIICKQEGKDTADLVYKEVKYFINFTDVLFIDDYYTQITDCMVYLIHDKMQRNSINFNRILVTQNGNFLLGIGVSQKLNTALIKVTEKPMIYNNQSWIGHFSDNQSDKSIIIHDVLVSGKQIKESISKIEKNTEVLAVFCLVNRLDYEGKKKIEEELGLEVHSLVDLGDEDIEKLCNSNM